MFPFPSLSFLLQKDGNATMQSKGDVSDTWCTKIVRGIRFPFARGGTPRFRHFPRSYPVMSIERHTQYRPSSTPLIIVQRIYTDFLISFLSIISPFFIIFTFLWFFPSFLLPLQYNVCMCLRVIGNVNMNETKLFTDLCRFSSTILLAIF